MPQADELPSITRDALRQMGCAETGRKIRYHFSPYEIEHWEEHNCLQSCVGKTKSV